MRKTKIIATLGPASLKNPVLEDLIKAGADVLRMNFSHLSKTEATAQLKIVHRAERRTGIKVSVLVDLKGPEIRSDGNTYKVQAGQNYYITTRGKPETREIGIDHPALYKLVKKGQRISFDDGRFEMKVLGIESNRIVVVNYSTGKIMPCRAVNVPRLDLRLPVVSEVDKAALRFVHENDVHWVAASFVNSASDVEKIRSILKRQGKIVPIISKIESFLAIQNIDEIVEASDGIMVARGDLGVDFDYEEIPILQDLVIAKAKEKGKVVIVATQMLESMLTAQTPKRAEVTDIAIATKDCVDAVMLSSETASGNYPVEAVQVMDRIVYKTEEARSGEVFQKFESISRIANLCNAGLRLAEASKSSHLVCISKSGRSPKVIAAHRPRIISLVATNDPVVYGRCRLYYSIVPVMFSSKKIQIEQISEIVEMLKEKRLISVGEKIVFIFSHALEKKNILRRVMRTKELATNCIIHYTIS